MLPEGWRKRRVGEVGAVTTGNTPPTNDPENYGGEIPFIAPRDLDQGKYIHTSERTLSEKGCQYARLLPARTVLATCIGSSIGKIGITTRSSTTNQQINAVIAGASHDAEFIYYQLEFHADALRRLAGTQAVPIVNKSTFESLLISIPASLGEEGKIAKLLRAWDDAIKVSENLLANLSKQKQVLLRGLLSGKHQFENPAGSWKYLDFDSIFERVARKNGIGNANVLTISAQYGLISQRDYFNKNVASENLSGYTLLERCEFAYNKSYSAGYPMGAIKPLLAYDAGVVSSLYLCFRIREDADADFDFFRHYFEAGFLDEEISGIAQEGARNHGLLNVSIPDFFKLRLHIPPVQVQRKIAEVLNVAEHEERMCELQLSRLQIEKRALMQQLLTGKRRVRLLEAEAEASPS